MFKFDRYDAMTLVASAILSSFAFIAANNEPQIQTITFEEPIVITARNISKEGE